jgi:hypothetical protein
VRTTIFRIVIPEVAGSNPVTHPSEMAGRDHVGDGSFFVGGSRFVSLRSSFSCMSNRA